MKNNVLLNVLIAMALGILAGWYTGPDMQLWGTPFLKIYELIGQLFLNALTLMTTPLVAASIIAGTSRMGADNSFGKLGSKTFGYFVATTACAIVTGLLCYLAFSSISTFSGPLPQAHSELLGSNVKGVPQGSFETLALILNKLIPSNILAVAAQSQLLGLIFFSLLFGYFISKVETNAATVLQNFWQGTFQVLMHMTNVVLYALPLGVFGLVAKEISITGWDAISSAGAFFAVALLTLGIYSLIVLPLILVFVGQINPLAQMRAVAPALLTAFSTSSSAAALPITIECVERDAGVSNRICSFAIPLGTSINRAGTALYQCMASLYIAHAYGVELTATILVIVPVMSLITSMGSAGIPSAGLVSITAILTTLGVPLEGIGLILATERILDMFRAVVNVFSNTCCTVLVARSEGEITHLILSKVTA